MTTSRQRLRLSLLAAAALAAAASSIVWGQESQQAEDVGREQCLFCHEMASSYAHTAHRDVECESCHGPGSLHIEAGGDDSLSLNLWKPARVNRTCLDCHSRVGGLSRFSAAPHGRGGLTCLECHALHPERPGLELLKAGETELCVSCHRSKEADFRKPFHHPVLEGGMSCADCHDPHTKDVSPVRRLSVTSESPSCVSCHSEKKGPFLFEHAPVKVNGCTTCHQPHGSVNAKMLTRNLVHQLCLECHSMTEGVAFKQPPAFHDIRTARFRNCTICHRQIHGSNSHRAFLR